MMNIIAACSRNRGIGLGGKLPWRFKKDLQYFKEMTIGDGNNAIVVGNSTYMRLPVLPKRDTLVLTNNQEAKTYSNNTYYFNSIPSLHEFCKGKNDIRMYGLLVGQMCINNFYLILWLSLFI